MDWHPDSMINEVVNEGGYKLLWERPFGIAIK
jgi:hypothetical protein